MPTSQRQLLMQVWPELEATVTLFEASVTKLAKQKDTRSHETKLAKYTASFFRQQGKIVFNALSRFWALNEADTDSTLDDALEQNNDRYAELLQRTIEDVFSIGIERTRSTFKLEPSFDVSDPQAVSYLQNYGASRLSEINNTTKARIKELIANGVQDGLSYDKIARLIRSEFSSYSNRPKNAPKHFRTRAQLVSVTEIGNAYQASQLATIRDAMSTGLEFEKKWSTTGDNRVSQGCKDNAAQGWIDINAMFQSGNDRPLRFPGCRCALLMRRKDA